MFRLSSNRRAKLMRRKKPANIVVVVPTQAAGVLKIASPHFLFRDHTLRPAAAAAGHAGRGACRSDGIGRCG